MKTAIRERHREIRTRTAIREYRREIRIRMAIRGYRREIRIRTVSWGHHRGVHTQMAGREYLREIHIRTECRRECLNLRICRKIRHRMLIRMPAAGLWNRRTPGREGLSPVHCRKP